LNNNFTGYGAVVVLGGGKANVSMNYGTANDALDCAFVAFSANDENFTCIDYDLESQNVSDGCVLFSQERT